MISASLNLLFGMNDKDIRSYFRAKAKQISALAELRVSGHPGLIGGHREQLSRIYLREVLPRRYDTKPTI